MAGEIDDYVAPEHDHCEGSIAVTSKSDIWAAGVVFFRMTTLKKPRFGVRIADSVPGRHLAQFALDHMLLHEPEARWTAAKISEHSLLKDELAEMERLVEAWKEPRAEG